MRNTMLSRKELEQKIIDVVEDTLALSTPPEMQQSIREDLNADSIDIVTLLVSLEDELATPFDQTALQGKETLQEISDFIYDHLKANQ